MKKLGILTHYENSTNYGGSLQAYALCKAVEQFGWQAQQIRIDAFSQCHNLVKNSYSVSCIKKLIKKPLSLRKPQINANRQNLLKVFAPFNRERTPHTEQLYKAATVKKTLQDFDAFAVGSDQVWNPIWYFEPFFLTFVPRGTVKFSYAASIAQNNLSDSVKARFRRHLKDFSGISVREQNAVSLLDGVAPGKVELVLDPTLLLDREAWQSIAGKPQLDKPYLFCYFLGDDPEPRQAAAEYAKLHGLTVVNIPNAAGLVHKNDAGFGDVLLPDPSPEDFLGWISGASCIMTDSFHASVFSIIFKRQFFTFTRAGHKAMSSRLYSLTDLFDLQDRFLDTPEKVRSLGTLADIDYSRPAPKYNNMLEFSLNYLRQCQKKAEG